MMKFLAIVGALAFSSTVMAAKSDLEIMTKLEKAGVQSEQHMSQIHMGADDVTCLISLQTGKLASCWLTDISANKGQGAELQLQGKKAEIILSLLESVNAPSDSGMGKTYISARSIRCHQAIEGVADGSAAERTNCSVELGESGDL